MEWISVEDELPKCRKFYDKEVMTKYSDNVLVTDGNECVVGNFIQIMDRPPVCFSLLGNSTHWMPLPPLPKVK